MEIREGTANVRVTLFDDVTVEAFNNSSGYEGWQGWVTTSIGAVQIITLGGGNVSVWELPGDRYQIN